MAQLPIGQFLTERLEEYDDTFELRSGTGFEQLFFKPVQFIAQPLRDEASDLFIGQSFRRILQQDDPDAFSEEAVDALASNLFVDRRTGGFSSGTARVYFAEPVDREYPEGGATFTGSNGLTYSNSAPFKITESQMSTQVEEGLYYMDVPVISDDAGADTELDEDELVTLEDDDEVVRVTNMNKILGGVDKETNTEFITRIQNSIGVRDLVTGKGFNAILFENFTNNLLEVQPIGFGDDEMMRDIVYNTHIGGRVDGYCKTSAIQTGYSDFVGLLVDTTRQTFTSANVQLSGTDYSTVGNPNIDRSNGLLPVVEQIKTSTSASYLSPVNLSSPIDLSVKQHVKISIDGDAKNVRVAGVNPGATTRNEILNLINNAFGINVAVAEGNSFRVVSPTTGLTSEIILDNPDIGNSALFEVFGLATGSAPYTYNGDGPITFVEGVHYEMDDGLGKIRRIIGTSILGTQSTGETTVDDDEFEDATANIFLNIQVNDIITIESGADAGDYRVLEKINNNTLRLDAEMTATATGIDYSIRRTGIKNEEIVYVQYYYNPLSIDIGDNVKLDEDGKIRGIRTGRENQTITDLVFLRILSIEIIDPLTGEPTGQELDGTGGFGQGGFGEGQFGVGAGSDYQLIVNEPADRFSTFEDSYIVIRTGYSGLSFRVNYEYVPEIEDFHTFVRSESERVLDGDILMKHFLPSYVDGTIQYAVDETDTSIPDNATLQTSVQNYINTQVRAGKNLEYSDINSFIQSQIDPFRRYESFIRKYTLEATIHNTDGTILRISGDEELEVPTLDPFPKDTPRPLSPRITHWIANDLVLERITR